MKKIIFILFFGFPILASAQSVIVGLQGGFSMMKASSADLESFLTSYNAQFPKQLKNPFPEHTQLMTGIQLGSTFKMGRKAVYYFSSVMWNETGTTYSADFVNGETRKLNVHYRDITADVGLGFHIGPVDLSLFAGMNTRWASMNASFVYANGIESFGPEKSFNGMYTTVRAVGYVGGELAIKPIKVLEIFGRYDWILGDGINSTYGDLAMYKSNGNNTSIPVNYSQNGVIGFQSVSDDSRCKKLTLGARWNFFTY